MTAKELIAKLEEVYPIEKAASWDNPGLQTGRSNKELRKVLVTLDITETVIEEAKQWGADMILAHHPMTMSGVKKISTDTLAGRRFLEAIQADLCCYSMHTNYDVVEMAPVAGEMMKLQKPQILDVTGIDEKSGAPEGFGRVGSLVRPVTLQECAEIVKQIFGVSKVQIFGDLEQIIQRVAISPGSGKSMIQPAIQTKAQVLISGDIGHHEGLDAMDQGLAVIDAGHYGLEHIFMERMCRWLQKHAPELEVKKAAQENPFVII
ncbi:MAG: Nif3-like dinuclear metal center hexameric protein [Eubacteriales bacterium]|nr:Nif3-like dinuclear metal center hexameric protein [Eubacteriales bacterium]